MKNTLKFPFEITSENITAGSYKLTEEQAQLLGFDENIHEKRFESLSEYLPGKARALCISTEYAKESTFFGAKVEKVTIHGTRIIENLRHSCGLTSEGRVSIKGKKISAFTSSQLFKLPSGHLVDCAVIIARIR